MTKKVLLVLLSSVVIGLVGCSGDDGGADPKIPLNDPNSKDQPTSVTGAGGGGGTTGSNSVPTQQPTTD